MARRSKQLNVWKIAWDWVENTEPEAISQENIETVYRIGVAKCLEGQCRKNCKANPNCLNNLGEKFWFGEIKDQYWLTCEDPEVERRGKDEFVGLKNLGATCYVNTFLQLWFHNHALRTALYACDPEESMLPSAYKVDNASANKETSKVQGNGEITEQNLETCAITKEPVIPNKTTEIPLLPGMLPLEPEEEPKSVYGHLQLLFAQLQYSMRRYIDPMAFITSLGLNTAQQQDAQEFSKLFMSLLEETLSNQPDPGVQHVIQKQFGGDYYYVTRCSNCGNASKRLSRFYELDLNIQGHITLNQYIKEFLKEERLEGDNRYFCTECNSKQNAERYIELNTLPPVLNLQLLRFVFDRKTGYKKKLNSLSQFPDVLDMREFLHNGPADSKKTRTQTPQCVNAVPRSSPKTDTAVEKKLVVTVQKYNTDLCDSLSNTKVESKTNETNDEKKSSDQEDEKTKKKTKYYVWWAEGKAGIVETWEECHSLIVNKKQSNCKKFNNLEQAQESLESKKKGIEILQEIKIESELKTNKEGERKGDEHRNKQQTEMIDSVNSVCGNIKETENDLAENGDSENEYLYELRAVLVHHGPSAYSGHYVAHIKDVKSGSWYKFNDEEIEKLKGKLKLSGDEEVAETGAKSAKRTKTAKGFHSSKNAYMLVYTKQNWGKTEASEMNAPSCVQELVARDNSRFEDWVSNVNKIRNLMVQEGKSRQSEIQRIYKLLSADEDYEWISTKWLREWMNEKQDRVPPVDNSLLLCSHGRLNPDKVQQTKKISCQAADLIFGKYGGLPRLKSDCLCLECVKARCSRIRFQSKLAADHKSISDMLKAVPESERGAGKWFWVGRMSLHSWRGLALKIFEEKLACNGLSVPDVDDPDNDTDKSGAESVDPEDKERRETSDEKNLVGLSDIDDGNRREFNEELLCMHGCLSTEESTRRLVPDEVWNKLKQYFPSASQFEAECCVCTHCKANQQEQRTRIELFKATASEQRVTLNHLYCDKQRPHMSLDEKEPTQVYVISRRFLDEWRQFLRFPTRRPPPVSINNSPLLCPHDYFLFDPQLVGADGADESLCYIFDHEWEVLSKAYSYDHAITITRETKENQDPKLVSFPACCIECHTALMYEQARQVEDFRQATIYVRKVTEDHNVKEINQTFSEIQSSDKDTQDPDFAGSVSKKPRLSDGGSERRSSRHRKQRGEVDVRVDSSLTLKKLKLELMKPFSVMPLDQHLSLNGTPLIDDTATLGRLGIRPGCLLLLKIDEPPQGEVITEDMVQVSRAPEQGFKGTGLLGH